MEYIRAALRDISLLDDVVVVGKSGAYESEPVGVNDQEDYLNAVIAVETTLTPQRLLDLLHDIEQKHGRNRITRWGPRTIDLDILLFDGVRQGNPELTIPHPRLSRRKFVLEPMLEIDPDVHLPDGKPARRLLEDLGDDQVVWRSGDL